MSRAPGDTLSRDATQPMPRSSLYRRRALGALALLAGLLCAVVASIAFGANPLAPEQVWTGLIHPDNSEASLIVWSERMPRTLVGIITGMAFGVAGALIQALTRNPLADPGILGVNAGAGFAATLGVAFFGISTTQGMMWWAFAGAAAATIVVFLIGSASKGAASPAVLVLAGIALAAVLNGISTFLTLIDDDTFQAIRNWGVGSISMTSLADLGTVTPFLVTGLVIAIVISGSLNTMALGDELAAALGAKIAVTRVLGILAVTLLAGGATAVTGGIAFIGLMVPHIVRWFVGPDQRWIIISSALTAPVILLLADVIGRVVDRPSEIEAGIVTAVIGAPVLIALVRRRKVSGL